MEFNGFPLECLEFLSEIRKNNSKDWFELHRDSYERFILEPSRAFVEEFGEHLMALEPTINFSPKINKSLYKIYRDTRREDAIAIPIKHRIGIIFWQGNHSRMQSSSFYLHFSPDELFVSAGVRWFEKPMLDAYRAYIQKDANREKLSKILNSLEQKDYNIIEKGYKRFPKGFDKSMKNAELSLYKGMATYKILNPILIANGKKLIDTLYNIYEDMLELQQFMYDVSLRREG